MSSQKASAVSGDTESQISKPRPPGYDFLPLPRSPPPRQGRLPQRTSSRSSCFRKGGCTWPRGAGAYSQPRLSRPPRPRLPAPSAPSRPVPPPLALPTFPPSSQPPRPRSPRPTNMIAEVTSEAPGGAYIQSRHSMRRRRPTGAGRRAGLPPAPSLIEAGGRAG